MEMPKIPMEMIQFTSIPRISLNMSFYIVVNFAQRGKLFDSARSQ